MVKMVTDFLVANPLICIFLALAIGYEVGKFRIKSFSLGSTVGVLIIGLLLGQIGTFKIDPILKSIFFDAFIFVVGFEVGPAFVSSLKHSGLKLVVQSLFFSAVVFGLAFTIFKTFKIGPGEAGGILAGALTQSATIGTVTAAIANLNISAAAKATMSSDVAIAYALTYVFGMIGVVIFLKNIAPAILHVNLKDETKKAIEALDFTEDNADQSPLLNNIATRSFKVVALQKKKLTVKKFERQFHGEVVVQQIFSHGQHSTFADDSVLAVGQVLTVIGNSQSLATLIQDGTYYQEQFADKYRQIPLKTAKVVLTNVFSYHVITQLRQHSIVIIAADRQGKPVKDLTTLRGEDRLTIAGPDRAVDQIIPKLGYTIANGSTTDISFLSIGLILGILLGAIVLTVKGVPITLGAGGGALIAGLFCGWYQGQHAQTGNIPSSTRWFLKSIGLNLFIAVVGLQAGSQFVSALKSMRVEVLLIGAVITIIPHLLTLLFSRFVLKLSTVDNLGSLAGSGTSNPSLNGLIEETGSSIFALSFTPTYAIGNILLTVMGPLIVALLAG